MTPQEEIIERLHKEITDNIKSTNNLPIFMTNKYN